jgi:rhodanese-related sulfurtransferase
MRLRLLAPAVLAASLTLAACGGGDGASSPAAAETASSVALVGPTEFQAAAAEPGVTVIDVRTPEEFAAGHLAGAQLIDIQAPGFEEAISALPRDGAYAVYCRSGNRSAAATALMAELGFTDITELADGIQAWAAAGLPIET